ncbi:arylsulfatase AtsD [Mycobacterium tuberculosis]|nr:arylsulfatase AtsD [Mycobacterium tuberculosis]
MPQPRTHLPIPSAARTGLITYDAKDPDSTYPPIEQLRPPAGAPNVLLILLDDVGFGASSAFGGPCRTSTAELLAGNGLRYNRFHTTALCSPTRQALLTGRNHHSAGMGGITEIATGAPGYSSVLPNTMSPIARTLKLNGYNTAQFGKCHEVPVWQTSPVGPFDAWPSGGGGFEYFYGFIGGEANQWYPSLYEGTTPVEVNRTPEEGYHFMADMTDKALGWIGQQKALAPDRPFFVYFAPGATHAPHHVPREWADKYRGRFDVGWDALREETFARQKELGVIPADCQLTARHAEIPAWDDMPEDLKPVLCRQMEVYAGFLEYTDHHVGRLVDGLQSLGVLDDTLVFYIIGDNGASAEGTINGTYNEMLNFNGLADIETPRFMTDRLDKFGGPESYNHYSVGWAHAMDTPYQWTKQVASHWGGTRNGTIVHWPNGIAAKGEMRWQFHHVIDVAPTILEAAGLPEPLFVNGVQQHPIEGVSMAYSFDDAQAPDRHETQYFEMFGNRGIYHKGWTAVTKHKTPWILVGEQTVAFDDDVWELYDTTKDWSQAKDLAKEMPEKLHELQRLWLIEATRYNVLPLDDDTASRINPDLAGRPVLIRGNTQVLFSNMGRLSENCVLNLKNKSHTVTAEVEVPETGAEGVIVAQGASIGGWSLYANDGKLKYCYNLGGIKHFYAESADPLPAGAHQVRMEFAYAGGGLGKGGEVTLYVDGQQVGEGHVEATLAIVFSADDGCDVGMDSGSPVSPDYARGVTRSTGGSRACSSRSPRPPLLRAIWSTRSTRSASRWRANRAAQSNGEGTAMEKSRCHAVAHGGGCAGSAKSHKSGGRCGQGRGAGDSHGTRGAGRRYRAASAPHPLAVGAHLRDELAKRSADPRLTDELNDLAGHTLDDL